MSKASGSIDLKSLKVAGEGASKYIAADNTGIMVYDGESGAQTPSGIIDGIRNVFIDDESVNIRDGQKVRASFGETTVIGNPSHEHIIIGPGGFHVFVNDRLMSASVSYGTTAAESHTLTSPYYVFGYRDVPFDYSYVKEHGCFEGFKCIYDGVVYMSNRSIPSGEEWTESHWDLAHGQYSFAEGMNSYAKAIESHAEGYNTIAGGAVSHAEGANTKATGVVSHAEGFYTEAAGVRSHAQNYHTIANGTNQTTIGKYNIPDIENAFIIGNGTGEDARSNALTVDWSGNITVSNHNSPIGTLLEESASGVSIASNTDWHYVTGCQVKLTPGSWIVSYSVMCTTLASGKRLGGALKNPDNSSIYYGSRSIMHASTSSAGAVSGVFPCVVTDDATSVKVQLMAFQTQGSSQDISGYIRAMRIV